MHVIHAQNVNDAYRQGLRLILSQGMRSESRNGPVLRMAAPVSTVYSMPHERVLFDQVRHANPFFHLFEALWMLDGRNDVETMDGFLKTFKQFSDDGQTFHGAYGHRWRHWPNHTKRIPWITEVDQIDTAIKMLKKDPTSRRVVISMWDPTRDLDADSKDIPCNDMIKLWIDEYRLHMVVFNRSNDIVWGCYGANAVHMSVLHEYISAMIDVVQGTLTQISCDFHAYLDTPYNVQKFISADLDETWEWRNPYESGQIATSRLVTDRPSFDKELRSVMEEIREVRSVRRIPSNVFMNAFFPDVVLPMHRAWEHVRRGEHVDALQLLEEQQKQFVGWRNDWIQSGADWIADTLARKEAKAS